MADSARPARRWLLVAAWLAVIFAFSSQSGTGSGDLSRHVTELIETVLGGQPGTSDPAALHHLVRKAAHFLEYLVLGAIVTWAWHAWPAGGNRPPAHESRPGPLRRLRANPAVGPFLVVVACAAFDETHQLIVPGRAGAATDVLIDSAGGAVGVALAAVLLARSARAGSRPADTP